MTRGDIKLLVDQLNCVCEPLLECDYETFGNVVDALEAQQAKIAEKRAECHAFYEEAERVIKQRDELAEQVKVLRDALETCGEQFDGEGNSETYCDYDKVLAALEATGEVT